jgi:site-specific DNA-methyltransferase (adenine-specific)
MQPNTLYFGDNLPVLRAHFPDECVDLLYLDPPFNSKRNFNMVFSDIAGAGDTAQLKAFGDTWTFAGAVADYNEVTESGWPEGQQVEIWRRIFGESPLVAYLSIMALRLRELHRVLKPAGTLYLHCDETAGPYLKILLDCIFGPDHFKTEVIWQRTNVHSDSRHWSDVRDGIYCYTKSGSYTWNPQHVGYDETYVASKYHHMDADGRRYQLDNMTSPNRRPNMIYEWMGYPSPRLGWRYEQATMQRLHDEGRIWYPRRADGSLDTAKRPRLKRYLDEGRGRLLGNIWTDIPPINSQAAERLGFPTQKPLALLERLIAASSNEGDVVLDPFCGCGTAVAAAHKLGRRWCGIDYTSLAVTLIRQRLSDHYPEIFPTPGQVPVIGLPKDVAGARLLAAENKYHFQFWALTLVGAHPPGGLEKKGPDRGSDGEILWRDGHGHLQRGIVSVKGGASVGITMLKDLDATLNAEKAALGLFVTLAPPTKRMLAHAGLAGSYTLPGTTATFPRLQILTIEDLLAGQEPKLPISSRLSPHKAAQPIDDAGQGSLDFNAD